MQEKINQQEATNQNSSSRNILELANKKLIFESDLNPNSNHNYIQTFNKSFLNAGWWAVQNFKKQIDACIRNDLDVMIQRICNLKHEEAKKKFGIYVNDQNKNKMSSLMYEWCMLIDYKNILWEILSTNKNCTNKDKLTNNFEETSSLRVYKLIKSEFCANSTSNNNSLSDIDENYLAYAKDEKNLDRYFMYFSMLKYLSEVHTKETETIEEFDKYNVEKINQIKIQNVENINGLKDKIASENILIKRIENQIDMLMQTKINETSAELGKQNMETIQMQNTELLAKRNLVLEYQSKILELEEKNKKLEKTTKHPLAKFYTENHEQIITVEKEIDHIKQKWSQQYYKFIFAFMLENPNQIFKLDEILDKNFPTVDFIEFLIKNSKHENFFYVCFEFDNLAKKLKLGFSEEELKLKTELQKKYQNEINGLDKNKISPVNLLFSNNREVTLEYQHMHVANWILFWCGLGTLIIAAAPILVLIIVNLPNIIMGILLAIPTLVLGMGCIVSVFADCSHGTVDLRLVAKDIKKMWSAMPWMAPRSFSIISTCYPSVFFLATLGISVAVFAVAGIFWAYKKSRYNNLVKSLKPPIKTYPYQKLLDNNVKQQVYSLGNSSKDNKDNAPALTTKQKLQK